MRGLFLSSRQSSYSGGFILVQRWCNWGGKDENYALYGQIVVNSIERMDGNYPHGKDVQSSRPIRSQTPVLSLSISLRFTQDKLVEGLYPLSYGCVVGRLYLFRGEKSRIASGEIYFGLFQKLPGAIPVQLKGEKIR